MPDAPTDPSFAAQSQAAFSSNPAHDFDDDDDRLHHHDGSSIGGGPPGAGAGIGPGGAGLNSMGDPERPSRLGHHPNSGFGRRDDDDEYALLHQSELDDGAPGGGGHPGAPGAYDPTIGAGGVIPPPAGSRIMHDYSDTGYGGPYGRYGPDEYGGSAYGR